MNTGTPTNNAASGHRGPTYRVRVLTSHGISELGGLGLGVAPVGVLLRAKTSARAGMRERTKSKN